MKSNLSQKIIRSHLVKPSALTPGEEISIRIDQTLTHDINAVMCYLAFEGIGIPRVKTEVSVSYLDHNLLYVDSKTPDDHIFLQTLAKHYGIPFYVLGPSSTIDLSCETGSDIPIELRDGEEIRSMHYEKPMAPEGVKCFNPAFDVTDHELIAGIITEKGIVRPPFKENLAALFG